MKNIRVTGVVTIEDDEFDDGPNGPLTEEAFLDLTSQLSIIDDINFELEH